MKSDQRVPRCKILQDSKTHPKYIKTIKMPICTMTSQDITSTVFSSIFGQSDAKKNNKIWTAFRNDALGVVRPTLRLAGSGNSHEGAIHLDFQASAADGQTSQWIRQDGGPPVCWRETKKADLLTYQTAMIFCHQTFFVCDRPGFSRSSPRFNLYKF